MGRPFDDCSTLAVYKNNVCERKPQGRPFYDLSSLQVHLNEGRAFSKPQGFLNRDLSAF